MRLSANTIFYRVGGICQVELFYVRRRQSRMVGSTDHVTEGTVPSGQKMTNGQRYEYVLMRQKVFRKVRRKEHRQLQDQMEHITGLNRKTLIAYLNRKITRKPRRKRCFCVSFIIPGLQGMLAAAVLTLLQRSGSSGSYTIKNFSC
jgi:hypothetical protein